MKKIILVVLAFASFSSFAKDCRPTAYKAARAVDSISNSSPQSGYSLQSAQLKKSVRSGGETLDTIEVSMVVNEDMSSVWAVDVYSADCVIKNVRFVRGD